MANNEWLDNMLENKISKEAMESQGTDKKDHFERKVQAHDWIKGITELDPAKVEAEYNEQLRQEAKLLGKTAALDDVIADGTTPEEVVNRDYKRDVSSLSDYALAEMLAEARGHKAQNTSEMFYELKEKAKAEVASSRDKAEKALLELIPDNAQLDWQKAFKEYSKNATPAEPKEKDLFKSDVPEKAHDFQHPSEDKFKMPKDAEEAIPGNGREADERTDVTEEAGVLKKDIVEGTSKEASKKKDRARMCGEPEHVEDSDKCPDLKRHDYFEKEAHCGECPGDPGMEQPGAAPAGDIEKDSAQNQAVLDAFMNGQGGVKSMNLTIVKGPKGLVLVNYETPIAYKAAGGDMYLNSQKYSPTTSTIQNKLRSMAQGQVKEVSPEELEKVMAEPAPVAAEAPAAAAADPIAAATESTVEKVAADGCPVCGGAGEDMKNGQQNHMSCKACGLTYASAEIKNAATKSEVIQKIAELKKVAEVPSPWTVTKDEQGNDVIARVDNSVPTNTKESEESKPEELLK